MIENDQRYAQLSVIKQLEDIPYFPQVEDQCGPASLATMLVVQGVEISPESLRGKIYIPGKEGAVTTEIIARARKFSLLSYVLKPNLIDMLMEIDAGNPVLVLQNLGFNWLPRWHFSVAVGYNLDKQTLVLRSGQVALHEVGFELFVKTWRRADSWAIVIIQPDMVPATATETNMLNGASELEQVGQNRAAFLAYKAILERWPDNSVAKFGAGNTAYAIGDYALAEQFFSSYIQLQPMVAGGWNNLAYSLVKKGCVSQAKKAIHCAISLASDDIFIRESYSEIMHLPDEQLDSRCEIRLCPAVEK